MNTDTVVLSHVEWHNPKDQIPPNLIGVLIVYEGMVWAGVYAHGRVMRFPEDFLPVLLSSCQWWAAFPPMPWKLAMGG